MKKMPTVFTRDYGTGARHVTDEVTPGCEWVLAGEGTASRKYDGTCVMLDEHGVWWARREVKPGKSEPPNFVAVDRDEVTEKVMGWEPVEQSSFAKYHAEALSHGTLIDDRPGTFELVGPRINGNPEHYPEHDLVRHEDAEPFAFTDRSYTELRRILTFLREKYGYEGVVFKHPDGRMAKLKAKDFPPEAP